MKNVQLYVALLILASVVVLALLFRPEPGGGSRRLEIILDPGFSGRLWLVEDPQLRPDNRGIYVLRQRGDTLPVPSGIAGGESSTRFFSVVRIMDRTGKVVSVGEVQPKGTLALRGYGVESNSRKPSGSTYTTRFYFDFLDQ